MEVDFRTNLGDIIQANFYMLPRSKTYRILGAILLVLIGGVSFYLASSPNLTSPFEGIVTFLITFVASLAVAAVIMGLILLIFLSTGFWFDRKEQTRECKLSSTANGIKLETAVARTDKYWSDIREISKTKTHVYIFIADGGAIIIPQRTFAQPEKADQFYEAITALWKSNKDTPHE